MTGTIYNDRTFAEYYGQTEWQSYRHLVADIIRHSMPGPILDVGSGVGFLVECARQFGLDALGIEGSEWACTQAKHRGLPMIQLDLASEWPLKDGSFATVVCNQVIEHVEPPVVRRVLTESYRVLKSGGTLLIYSPSPWNRAERGAFGHINLHEPSRLRAAVEAAHFQIIEEPNYLERGGLPWRILYRATKWERLLGSANCVARKP